MLNQNSLRLSQVLDRVLAKVGGKQWWANVSGRAKAQQIWAAHQNGAKVVCPTAAVEHGLLLQLLAKLSLLAGLQGDTIKDLNNYGLSARGRYAHGR